MAISRPTDADRGACVVCDRHRRDQDATPASLIYRDDLIVISHASPRPASTDVYLGYLILESRRHAAGLADLTRAEAHATGAWVTTMARALTDVLAAEHIYAFVLGDDVSHFHEHVVPRYAHAPREFWGVRVAEWSEAPRGDAQAVALLCDRLREWLAHHPETAGPPT